MFQAPTAAQLPPALAAEVQEWVAGLQPPGFPASLASRFLLPPAEATLTNQRYNVTLLNSFVFFVGLTVRPVLLRGPAAATCKWRNVCCVCCVRSFTACTQVTPRQGIAAMLWTCTPQCTSLTPACCITSLWRSSMSAVDLTYLAPAAGHQGQELQRAAHAE